MLFQNIGILDTSLRFDKREILVLRLEKRIVFFCGEKIKA